MLHYNRIDLSKGIDPAISNNSRECIVCHQWFFNHELEFQDLACNDCHDLIILHVNISDIPFYYHC